MRQPIGRDAYPQMTRSEVVMPDPEWELPEHVGPVFEVVDRYENLLSWSTDREEALRLLDLFGGQCYLRTVEA